LNLVKEKKGGKFLPQYPVIKLGYPFYEDVIVQPEYLQITNSIYPLSGGTPLQIEREK